MMALLYPAVLVAAAISDILWLRIPNWLSIFLVAWFVVFALVTGMAFDAIALRMGVGAAVLFCGFGLYSFGLLGGGDVKLIAASAIWVGAGELMMFLLVVAICGGILAAAVFFARRIYLPTPGWLLEKQWFARLITDGNGIPYAVAICAGGLITFHDALTALAEG